MQTPGLSCGSETYFRFFYHSDAFSFLSCRPKSSKLHRHLFPRCTIRTIMGKPCCMLCSLQKPGKLFSLNEPYVKYPFPPLKIHSPFSFHFDNPHTSSSSSSLSPCISISRPFLSRFFLFSSCTCASQTLNSATFKRVKTSETPDLEDKILTLHEV